MALRYENSALMMEDVSLSNVAQAIGTPVYVYSKASIVAAYGAYKAAFSCFPGAMVCYAVKANTNQAVIGTLATLGAGADVVSEGELRRALSAGIPASKIVYSGVAKRPAEMAFALKAGIFQFNVESEPELLALGKVASSLGLTANIALRVNPDVDARTHAKISTGKAENKFGIPWQRVRQVYAEAASSPGIRIQGIAMHIGSQLMSLEPYDAAYARLAEMVAALKADGIALDTIDIGGGLGIPYDGGAAPDVSALAALAYKHLGQFGARLMLEPGRSLVGPCGALLSEVIYVKSGESRDFLIVDAAMNDLIRPAMYDAHHGIKPLKAEARPAATYDVVGPVCETGDTFAVGRELPELRAGEYIALSHAGAYGAVMASTYNSRLLVPEVMVDGADFVVIRPRGTYDDLIGADTPWQGGGPAEKIAEHAGEEAAVNTG